MLSHFSRTPTCDRRTDRHTMTANSLIPALSSITWVKTGVILTICSSGTGCHGNQWHSYRRFIGFNEPETLSQHSRPKWHRKTRHPNTTHWMEKCMNSAGCCNTEFRPNSVPQVLNSGPGYWTTPLAGLEMYPRCPWPDCWTWISQSIAVPLMATVNRGVTITTRHTFMNENWVW